MQQQRSSNLQITGSRIKEKARDFARKFGSHDFKASEGWLERFKTRNNSTLRFYNKKSGPEESFNWMEMSYLPMLKNFKPQNIFTLGEFGFLYRARPQKIFGLRNNCVDGHLSTERLTVVVGANKSGTEKLPLMVIGKFQHPRSLRNVKSLPAKYQHEQNAWMTAELFEDFMLTMNKKFEKEKRFVLVVVETSGIHSSSLVPKLTNIQLVIQQPKSPSPLRHGIVKNLKNFYRKEVVIKEVEIIGEGKDAAGEIDVLEAMKMLAESWENVTREMITKSFAKAGWNQESDEIDDDNEDEVQLDSMLKTSLRILKLDATAYNDFLTFDDDVATSGTLSDSEICKIVMEDSGQHFAFENFKPDVITTTEKLPRNSKKSTRKFTTVAEKLAIIDRKNAGNVTNEQLCTEFGVTKSSLLKVFRAEGILRAKIEKNPHMMNSRKLRGSNEPELDVALRKWVDETKSYSHVKVREKALELAKELGCKDFKASNGWWSRFRIRSGMGQEKKVAAYKSCDLSVEDPLLGI